MVSASSGTTPAMGTTQFFRIVEQPNEPSDEEFRSSAGGHTVSVIGPKGHDNSGTIEAPFDLVAGYTSERPLGDRRYTADSRRGLFFSGWMVYHDVFPKNKPHLTEFCQQLVTIGSGVPPGESAPPGTKFRMTFTGCRQHNCVDNYCDDYDAVAAMVRQSPPATQI
jgi:hypothetical protein